MINFRLFFSLEFGWSTFLVDTVIDFSHNPHPFFFTESAPPTLFGVAMSVHFFSNGRSFCPVGDSDRELAHVDLTPIVYVIERHNNPFVLAILL